MIRSYIITIMYKPYLSALLIKSVIEQKSAAAQIIVDNFLCVICDVSITVSARVHVKSSLSLSLLSQRMYADGDGKPVAHR